jgi:hypothetical protein
LKELQKLRPQGKRMIGRDFQVLVVGVLRLVGLVALLVYMLRKRVSVT